MENLRKAVHALFEDRLQRLRRHVAAGEAGAAGGDDHVDRSRPATRTSTRSRILSLSSVTMSRAASMWPASVDAVGERLAGFVVGKRARVGDGQHRDADRDERAAFRQAAALVSAPPLSRRDHEPVGLAAANLRGRFAARAAFSNRPKQVAPEPDMRAKPRAGLSERRQRVADLGRDRAGRRLQVVAGCAQPVDRPRQQMPGGQRRQAGIVARRERAEHLRRRDRHAGIDQHQMQRREVRRRTSILSPMPRAISGRPARHIGTSAPSAEADPRQLAAARPQSRAVQRPQRRRRIARSAADAGRDRQVLFQLDRDRLAVG